jgi:hypothetical protein
MLCSKPWPPACRLLGLVDDAGLRREMADSARTYALSQTWQAINGRLRERYLAVASVDRTAAVRSTAG